MNRSKVEKDIVQSATSMKAHYDTWWALVSEGRSISNYASILLDYSDFIKASEDAHFTSAFVYFSHLYDKRSDVSSIPIYLSIIQNDTEVALFNDFISRYDKLKVRAEPILKMRHKLIAHIDANLTEKEFFSKYNKTYDEERSVVHDTAEFVASLVGSKSGEIGIPREGRMSETVLKVLKKLLEKEV